MDYFVLALSTVVSGGVFIMLGADVFIKRYAGWLFIAPFTSFLFASLLYSILPLWSYFYYASAFTLIYALLARYSPYEGFKIGLLSVYCLAFLWELPIHVQTWLTGELGYLMALPQIFALSYFIYLFRKQPALYGLIIIGIVAGFGLFLDPYYNPYEYMAFTKILWITIFTGIVYVYRQNKYNRLSIA